MKPVMAAAAFLLLSLPAHAQVSVIQADYEEVITDLEGRARFTEIGRHTFDELGRHRRDWTTLYGESVSRDRLPRPATSFEPGDLPVIFISGYGRDETIARALETGAVDYIVKPFSTTELTARIRAALRRRPSPNPSCSRIWSSTTTAAG